MSIWKMLEDAIDVAEEFVNDKPYFDSISAWLQLSIEDASNEIGDFVFNATDDEVAKMGEMLLDSASMNIGLKERRMSTKFYVLYKMAETERYGEFVGFEN